MTFTELSKRIATCYNSLPALIDALKEGFSVVDLKAGDISYGDGSVENALDSSVPKTDIATVESGSTASKNYSAGELVYVNGTLYEVKTAIANGAAFTVGTNIQSTTVSETVKDASVKVGTVSGTTSSLGNLVTNLKVSEINIIGARCTNVSGAIALVSEIATTPPTYGFHVTNYNGSMTAVASTVVQIKYFYL